MARGVVKFRTMNEFGRHRSGGGGSMLKGWKKTPGWIETWMHTQWLPMAVYRHQIPQVVIVKDRDTRDPVKRVFSKSFVCHETESVLEGQYFRDRDTGERKHKPDRCGVCKLVEWCWQQSNVFEETRDDKKPNGLRFTTPIFKFEGDLPDETAVLHVGGVANLFNKDLNDAQKKDMKDAHIRVSDAWKENAWAKCQYVMRIVDDAHPELGVQTAVEASSLGDKVKEKLNDELDNDVDIQRSPYCIKWVYDEKQTDLNKKYKAVVLRKKHITPRILKLIRGPVEDLSEDLTTPFNQQSLRATLERHCLLPKGTVPWDEIFPTPEQEKKWALEDEAEEKAAAAEVPDDDEVDTSGSEEGTKLSPRRLRDEDEEDEDDEEKEDEDDEEEDEDEEEKEDDEEDEDEDEDKEMAECVECHKPMLMSASKCPHCGAEYDEDEAEEEAKPPPKMKSRGESRGAKSAAAPKAKSKPAGGGGSAKRSRAASATTGHPDDGDQESDVPFIRVMSIEPRV